MIMAACFDEEKGNYRSRLPSPRIIRKARFSLGRIFSGTIEEKTGGVNKVNPVFFIK